MTVHTVARFACHFAVGFVFAAGLYSVLSTFLWSWLAFFLTLLLSVVLSTSLTAVGDEVYTRSVSVCGWIGSRVQALRA